MKLSRGAKRVLELLDGESRSVEELSGEGLDQSLVNRAALELEEKELVEVEEESSDSLVVTDRGEIVLEHGSPEYRLVDQLREGPVEVGEVDLPEVAIGKARQNGWVEIEDGRILLTEKGREVDEDPVRQALEEREQADELESRGLLGREEKVRRVLRPTEAAEKLQLDEVEEEFDVEAPVQTPRTGKRHFYRRIMDEAREVWVEMGFREMDGDYVTCSLMNFDALYTPQDHPARNMHDTFYMERPARADLDQFGDLAERLGEVHRRGGDTGSTGWGGDWSRDEAARYVLRTHTTDISARKLYELEKDDLPAKFFTLGRNFRNETVDRHHLAEFYQTDGIVVGTELNFRNLKGYISEFFRKMGYPEVRLVPTYYPYTEMSVEVQVMDGEEWVGLGGAGMFRPEVTKPLLGFEATVLAWGLGIGRIAMGNAGLDDIRELYRNDLEILEQTPAWRRTG